MKRILSAPISIVVLIGLAFTANAEALSANEFTDVKPSDWYYDAVDYAASNGLFSGTSATTFSPNTSMTRGMFVTVLGRLAKVPDTYGRTKSTPFSDVTQADYFFPFTVWANDNGIVTGVGNNTFNPNGEIILEQMEAILFRYAEKFGCDVTYSAEAYNSFSDTASVSGYAVTAMQWAAAHGILNGSNSKLNPQNPASRAQVAQVFFNFSRLAATSAEPTEPDDDASQWENYNPKYEHPTGESALDADSGYFDYDLANEIMTQVDALRVENGLSTLLYHPKTQEWAGIRAQEQTTREGHTRPDGTLFSTVGQGLTSENITILVNCTGSQRNDIYTLAKRAVNNWYTSTSGHKEAM